VLVFSCHLLQRPENGELSGKSCLGCSLCKCLSSFLWQAAPGQKMLWLIKSGLGGQCLILPYLGRAGNGTEWPSLAPGPMGVHASSLPFRKTMLLALLLHSLPPLYWHSPVLNYLPVLRSEFMLVAWVMWQGHMPWFLLWLLANSEATEKCEECECSHLLYPPFDDDGGSLL
jgi:hypothetical protein